MSDESLHRQEFEGYVRRHEADRFAHAPLVERTLGDALIFRHATDGRLSALERWQQRIIGGLMFGAVLLGSGAVLAVVELFRH